MQSSSLRVCLAPVGFRWTSMCRGEGHSNFNDKAPTPEPETLNIGLLSRNFDNLGLFNLAIEALAISG